MDMKCTLNYRMTHTKQSSTEFLSHQNNHFFSNNIGNNMYCHLIHRFYTCLKKYNTMQQTCLKIFYFTVPVTQMIVLRLL